MMQDAQYISQSKVLSPIKIFLKRKKYLRFESHQNNYFLVQNEEVKD